MPSEQQTPTNKTKMQLPLDLRAVVAVLLIVIAVMLFLWQPWSGTNDRTISVSGEATVLAEPDEYLFNPSYQFTNADKDAALAQVTQKSDEVVTKLKELGVEDKDIKTNSGGYDLMLRGEPSSDDTTYNLTVTITVNNLDLAQKVQDYLLTTSPVGAVTPQPAFSDAKRKELEAQARSQAIQDARAKAEQSAQDLGFSLGSVKEVADGSGFGVSYDPAIPEVAQDRQLTIQPGQNELSYSVTVVYYVK